MLQFRYLPYNIHKMHPSTSSSLPSLDLSSNLHYARRLLLNTPFNHLQSTTLAPPPSYQLYPSTSSHGRFNANLVMVLTVLLFALICSLCVNSFIKCVLKCSSLLVREPNYNINLIIRKDVSNGLDKRALKTFPTEKYSKDVSMQGLDSECVICLSEFQDDERIRILPKCHHGFHVKCIDEWLSSHSSCPTCRQCLVDPCKKIIKSDDNDQSIFSSSLSAVAVTGEVIAVIAPLEREDLTRNYREQQVAPS